MVRNVITLVTYTLLFLVAIPWYWQYVPSAERLVLGFPLWVAVSLIGAFGIAVQTALVLRQPWPGEEDQI